MYNHDSEPMGERSAWLVRTAVNMYGLWGVAMEVM